MNMAKCIVMYNHKVPTSLYSIISRKALKKMLQMKGDAAKILAIINAKLGRVAVRERQDSTASCPPELNGNAKIDPLREHKCETFPRGGTSRKRGLWQRKLSLTVEQERGLLQDYSKSSLPRGKKEKELKVKTHFEVDFEDSTCEEEIDIEELKRILASSFNSEGESSIEDDGFLTTTLCSTEL